MVNTRRRTNINKEDKDNFNRYVKEENENDNIPEVLSNIAENLFLLSEHSNNSLNNENSIPSNNNNNNNNNNNKSIGSNIINETKNKLQCQHCKHRFSIGEEFLKHIEESNIDGKSYKPKFETCKKFGVNICLKCKKYMIHLDGHECVISKDLLRFVVAQVESPN